MRKAGASSLSCKVDAPTENPSLNSKPEILIFGGEASGDGSDIVVDCSGSKVGSKSKTS